MILNGRGRDEVVLMATSRQITVAFVVFFPFDNKLLRVFVEVNF